MIFPYEALTCSGRPVDESGRPVGPACGARFHQRCSRCLNALWEVRARHLEALVEQARAAGWGVRVESGGIKSMCPPCRAPGGDRRPAAGGPAVDRPTLWEAEG